MSEYLILLCGNANSSNREILRLLSLQEVILNKPERFPLFPLYIAVAKSYFYKIWKNPQFRRFSFHDYNKGKSCAFPPFYKWVRLCISEKNKSLRNKNSPPKRIMLTETLIAEGYNTFSLWSKRRIRGMTAKIPSNIK